MSEPLDMRAQVAMALAPHAQGCPHVATIMRYLASDQAKGWYDSAFHQRRGSRWSPAGGLAQAFMTAYKALRILEKCCDALYGPVQIDRAVMCLAVIMLSRWADLRDGKLTQVEAGEHRAHGSMITTSLSNLMALNITDCSTVELQVITCWYKSRAQMREDHEPFNALWWVMHQTFDLVYVVGEQG